MDTIFNVAFLVGLLAASLRMATPMIFGAMGELFNEKSGVLNLGIEGIMTLGAFVGFMTAYFSGNLWLGVLAAGISGSIASLILAVSAVSLGINQVVVGLGINFAATGFSYFSYQFLIGTPLVVPTVKKFPPFHIPGLSNLPILGPSLFQQNVIVYIAFGVVGLAAFILYRTSWGLKIRTVGQVPLAADTIGVNVFAVRYLCLLGGGFLIGVGGGVLSLVNSRMFIQGIVAGRGWICIALVVFGGYRPGRCLAGALLFGFIDAFQLRLQSLGFEFPYQLLLILPYVITLLALIVVARKAIYPAALRIPYRREE